MLGGIADVVNLSQLEEEVCIMLMLLRVEKVEEGKWDSWMDAVLYSMQVRTRVWR